MKAASPSSVSSSLLDSILKADDDGGGGGRGFVLPTFSTTFRSPASMPRVMLASMPRVVTIRVVACLGAAAGGGGGGDGNASCPCRAAGMAAPRRLFARCRLGCRVSVWATAIDEDGLRCSDSLRCSEGCGGGGGRCCRRSAAGPRLAAVPRETLSTVGGLARPAAPPMAPIVTPGMITRQVRLTPHAA